MLEVRWSSDEGTVMVVKELGACWKCAGAVTKGPVNGRSYAVNASLKSGRKSTVEVNWSWKKKKKKLN